MFNNIPHSGYFFNRVNFFSGKILLNTMIFSTPALPDAEKYPYPGRGKPCKKTAVRFFCGQRFDIFLQIRESGKP